MICGRVATLIPIALLAAAGCCHDIPDVDSSPPSLYLRVFDDDQSIVYDLDDPDAFAASFRTTQDYVHVQFGVSDNGGIAFMTLRLFGGRFTYTNRPPLTQTYAAPWDILRFDGDRDCARDKINTVTEVRPEPGARLPSVGIRMLAEDFGGLSGTPNQTESPQLQIDFR